MKAHEKELTRQCLKDLLDKIRSHALTNPIGINMVIDHVRKALETNRISLKSMGTNRQELILLRKLAVDCLEKENPEETCKEKLREMYPESNTMSAVA